MRKILIIGHARHGKDTVAELLAEQLQAKFNSSSRAVCDHHIYPMLAKFYVDSDACYNDRINCRDLWAALIRDYCAKDKARLAKLIFEHNDIYVGLRNREEFDAVRIAFDPFVIWVDACKRKPLEPSSSMELTSNLAHLYIDNNHTLESLAADVKFKVRHLGSKVLRASAAGSRLEQGS